MKAEKIPLKVIVIIIRRWGLLHHSLKEKVVFI